MLAYLRAPLLICRMQRALLLGAGVDDRLGQFHVVDVERADREPAVVGEVEHRLGGHQRHIEGPFNWIRGRACRMAGENENGKDRGFGAGIQTADDEATAACGLALVIGGRRLLSRKRLRRS